MHAALRINTVFILFFLFISARSYSQKTDTLLIRVIEGVNKYRNSIFQKDSQGIIIYGLLVEECRMKNLILRSIPGTVKKAYYFNKQRGKYEPIKSDELKAALGDSSVLNIWHIDILDLLFHNRDLSNAIDMDVFDDSYPFKTKIKSDYFEEMQFYKLQDGMTIAEIGAGDGIFSILLASIFRNVKLYVNELESYQLKNIREAFNRIDTRDPTNQITLIEGSHSSTNLDDDLFDRIIIRDAFHHFTKRNKMLKSLYRNLKPGGILYLMEPEYNEIKESYECPLKLTDAEIQSSVSRAGFRLGNLKMINNMVLYEYLK
jgi:ubiquinone/menaquinone biosynthesis C-methylase UbiE